jgi:hypothetical protein
MMKTKIIEGDRNTFVKELEKAENEGWMPRMRSKNTIFNKGMKYAHHSIVCQRWEV